jgi:hypothetical protein
MNEVLLYIGAALAIVWGIAHLVVTRSVVDGFGEITRDNRFIITQEWIAEGITICFVGCLVIFVTALVGPLNNASLIVYRASAAFLVVVGLLTAATGARTPIVPFKICPFLLTGVAVLFLLGSFL